MADKTYPDADGSAMDAPRRVQLSRKRGWRMPENTVKVSRPGKWGNPFLVEQEPGVRWLCAGEPAVRTWSVRCLMNPHHSGRLCPPDFVTGLARIDAIGRAIERFRAVIAPRLPVSELRGKNLACWCSLDQPCHADVLLELANKDEAP